jgi:hypothetical protein
MTAVPDAAVTAAALPDELPPGTLEAGALAIHRLRSPGDPCGCTIEGEHEGTFAADMDEASEAVWAAYPFIAAQAAAAERERIAAEILQLPAALYSRADIAALIRARGTP